MATHSTSLTKLNHTRGHVLKTKSQSKNTNFLAPHHDANNIGNAGLERGLVTSIDQQFELQELLFPATGAVEKRFQESPAFTTDVGNFSAVPPTGSGRICRSNAEDASTSEGS